jgi:hypothetical protein
LFDKYAKKLKDLGADVPDVFRKVAKKGAVKFVKEAKNRTDNEHLVDTGNYKRNWFAEAEQVLPNTYAIICQNNVDYASFLEEGHRMRDGKRWKGRFVGKQSLDATEGYTILELREEIEKMMNRK